MPYIGNTIRAADDYRLIDDISSSFNGSTTSFALQVAGSAPVPFPKSPQQVLISVNGVIQEPDPTGSSGFNLVGTNIVFSSAPTNGHAFFGIIYATADYLNSGGNFPSGSTGAPSLTFIGDEDTGIYRKGSGSVGFVSNSTEIANTDSNGITISSGNLILGDSSGANDDRIKLGADGDLQIYHDGNNSYIKDTGTGRIKLVSNEVQIRNAADNETIALFAENGAVELYHDNSKKAETASGGFTVTGVCTATSFAGDGSSLSGINTDLVSDTSPQLGGALDTNGNNINFGDSTSNGNNVNRLRFGTGTNGDLEIYHDGSHSYVQDRGTGELRIRGAEVVRIQDTDSAENMGVFNKNGSVELYHDNSKKFETTSEGALFSGAVGINGTNLSHAVNTLKIGHEGNGVHQLRAYGPDTSTNGSIQLRSSRSNGSNSFDITYDGNLSFPDDQNVLMGAGNDLQLFHESSSNDSFIIHQNENGHLRICSGVNGNGGIKLKNRTNNESYIDCDSDGAVQIYYDNSSKFSTRSDGVNILGIAEVYGQVRPNANNTHDLGTASLRWANVYTNDLNLSNEGGANDVDQTWGDYTIQEGFEDLFLINNRTGKKFKFNLTEVS